MYRGDVFYHLIIMYHFTFAITFILFETCPSDSGLRLCFVDKHRHHNSIFVSRAVQTQEFGA